MKIIGLDVLGDNSPALPAPQPAIGQGLLAIILAAGVGYVIGRRYHHPYLGLLGGASLGRNGYQMATGNVTKALVGLGSTGLGIAGSLYLPVHPATGYIAGNLVGTLGGLALAYKMGDK